MAEKATGIKVDASLIKDLRDSKPEWKKSNATFLIDLILRERLQEIKKIPQDLIAELKEIAPEIFQSQKTIRFSELITDGSEADVQRVIRDAIITTLQTFYIWSLDEGYTMEQVEKYVSLGRENIAKIIGYSKDMFASALYRLVLAGDVIMGRQDKTFKYYLPTRGQQPSKSLKEKQADPRYLEVMVAGFLSSANAINFETGFAVEKIAENTRQFPENTSTVLQRLIADDQVTMEQQKTVTRYYIASNTKTYYVYIARELKYFSKGPTFSLGVDDLMKIQPDPNMRLTTTPFFPKPSTKNVTAFSPHLLMLQYYVNILSKL